MTADDDRTDAGDAALDAFDELESRIVLDYAIVCTAFALAVAAVASEHVIGAWAAGWAYLVAIALAAWSRSWLVIPLALATVMLELGRADVVWQALAAAAAQLVLAGVAIVAVRAVRRHTDHA